MAQILSDGPKPRQRATPTKGMSVSKARERAAQMEAELQTPSPPPAKKVVANASMRRFRTAREMQQQIDSIQQELDATKDYYAEVMTALQTEQERVDFQDKRLVSTDHDTPPPLYIYRSAVQYKLSRYCTIQPSSAVQHGQRHRPRTTA